MIRLVAALLALATAIPALAQVRSDAALIQLIRGSYSRYIGADAAPRANFPATGRFKAAEAECAALYRRSGGKDAPGSNGVCGDDYDLFCQCRDYWGIDWSRMAITISHPGADRAEAVVTLPRVRTAQAGGPAVRLIFVRGEREWLLDDVWEYARGKGGYRARLTAHIEKMRKRHRPG